MKIQLAMCGMNNKQQYSFGGMPGRVKPIKTSDLDFTDDMCLLAELHCA